MLKRKIGLILIIAGIAIFLLLMAGVLLQELVTWLTDKAFRMKYESYFAMVAERVKSLLGLRSSQVLCPG